MTAFVLKLIACITMFIDHYTYIFIPWTGKVLTSVSGIPMVTSYVLGRGIGRIAFPIYCFLLVEGYYHTGNRKKYMLRMAVFALISEFPFDLAFQVTGTQLCLSRMMGSQNVMFTLLLGLILMYLYDLLKMKYMMQPVIFNTLGAILIVGVSGIATALRTDYSYVGIIFILIFYLFRGKKIWIFGGLYTVILLFSNRLELCALLALVPIFFYNGEEGPKLKYLFYAFYPVHLLVLGGIAGLVR